MTSTVFDLSLDGWTAISSYCDVPSLVAAGSCCNELRHVLDNQTLWSSKARTAWPLAADAIGCDCDWPRAYRAAASSACQLSTADAWSTSISRPYGVHPPAAAQLHILRHDSSHASWQPPTVAAALDQRLVWCCPSTLHCWQPQPQLLLPADAVCYSDPQHGHTAFVDVLIEVPAGSSCGYASGSRDTTIKLWTPFSSNSRSAGGVRPLRTLRGHTGSITALLCVPSGATSNHLSSGSMAAGATLLASASADKTIKLWSLPALGQGNSSGSSRANNCCYAEDAVCLADADGRRSGRCTGTRVNQTSSLQQQQHQQGRNPLLATLRGHGDSVTDLLLHNKASSSSSSRGGSSSSIGSGLGCDSCMLLSSSRDGRIKQWDCASQACAATWRLQSPCLKLVSGFNPAGHAVAVLTAAGLCLVDLRCRGSSAAGAVMRLQGSQGFAVSSALTCAAGCGSMLAAGGRRGVLLWDVRAPNSTSSSASSTASSRVLLNARMPNNEPVSAVHLDRVKLVACTRRVVLHSAASISVWSVVAGHRLQQLSTTLSGMNLQDTRAAAAGAAGMEQQAINTDDAWELLEGMTERDMNEALNIMHQQQQQQQQPPVPQGGNPLPPFPGLAVLPQQHEIVAAAAGLHNEHDAGADANYNNVGHHAAAAADYGSESDWDSDGSGSETDSSDASSEAAGVAGAGGSSRASCWGRVEPGVVAMAVDGPVIATVDTLGHILIQDFLQGMPSIDMLRQHSCDMSTAAIGPAAPACSSTKLPGGHSNTCKAGVGVAAGAVSAAADAAATSAAAGAASQQPAGTASSRFWKP